LRVLGVVYTVLPFDIRNGGRLRTVTHDAGRKMTPWGTSPLVTRHHSAISSLRANATIIVLRVLARLSAVRAANHWHRSLFEYSQIAEPRGIEFSSVFASIPAMESSTLDGGFLGIEFSSESMIANTRTGS
jgi:hypothetical protein